MDAGIDAGADADTDTGLDAGPDTDSDTNSDTDLDAGLDASTPECGDGELWDADGGAGSEICDDGNTNGGDFCSADCSFAGWHTFYGSLTHEYGVSVAVDESGNIYVAGGSFNTWAGPAGESPLHPYSWGGVTFSS